MTGGLSPLDVPVLIGRDEARRRALDELAKAKYGGTPDWLQQVGDRVSANLQRLLEVWARWQQNRTGDGVSPGFVVAVVLLLVAVAVVVWRVGLPRWRHRRPAAALDLDPSRPAADYRASAQHYAESGAWREAVRDRFRAVVRELEIRTVLDVRPARTAWEAAYAASRTLPAAEEALHAGAELFNTVVYGGGLAEAGAYARMVGIDETVTRTADTADLAAAPGPT